MLKFGSWKKKDKWLFVLTMGAILCILAIPLGGTGKKGIAVWNGALLGENQSGTARGDRTGATAGIAADTAAGMTPDTAAAPASAAGSTTYEQQLETRVRDILSKVDGVGKVDVMITLKTSGEKVIHVDGKTTHSVTREQDTSGGTRNIENDEQEQSTILTSADGEDSPIIEKELFPELSGIIISAEGGGSPTICAQISAAMEALFGLPPNRIIVLKRGE